MARLAQPKNVPMQRRTIPVPHRTAPNLGACPRPSCGAAALDDRDIPAPARLCPRLFQLRGWSRRKASRTRVQQRLVAKANPSELDSKVSSSQTFAWHGGDVTRFLTR